MGDLAHYYRHRDEVLAKQRAKYAEHREEILAKLRSAYQVTHPGAKPRSAGQSHPKSREERLAAMKEYHKATYVYRRDNKNAQRRERRKKTNWYQENREKILAARKAYYWSHREESKAKSKAAAATERIKVLQHYGGKCACCGETEPKFLAIDHVNNNGAAHRREIGHGGKVLYRWLIKNNFPEGFQVLCHNCNMAKGLYGKCPHQERGENNETR